MGHYDDCRESANWVDRKKEAYDYYKRELTQLSSAIELIKAIANGYGEDGSEIHDGMYATTTPRNACDKWLMDNGYECEATRQAQRIKRRIEVDNQIERLKQEKKALVGESNK